MRCNLTMILIFFLSSISSSLAFSNARRRAICFTLMLSISLMSDRIVRTKFDFFILASSWFRSRSATLKSVRTESETRSRMLPVRFCISSPWLGAWLSLAARMRASSTALPGALLTAILSSARCPRADASRRAITASRPMDAAENFAASTLRAAVRWSCCGCSLHAVCPRAVLTFASFGRCLLPARSASEPLSQLLRVALAPTSSAKSSPKETSSFGRCACVPSPPPRATFRHTARQSVRRNAWPLCAYGCAACAGRSAP
mmetsp:Transcript_1201/g.2649  ORF Transcript_1201/g.2649 Transcript_1201/m.2649 type:complete len:260 (-) Transcript_1201:113-892(-)